jgi:rhodanese-related sulfurtransferase
MFIVLLGAASYVLASVCLFHHYVVRVHRARSWIAYGAILVDVDTSDEFARHHPPRAVNVPLESLERRMTETADKSRPVVVFAHSWMRGAKATLALRLGGFRRVLNAAGLHTREKLGADAPWVIEPVDLIALVRAPRSERAKENLAPRRARG